MEGPLISQKHRGALGTGTLLNKRLFHQELFRSKLHGYKTVAGPAGTEYSTEPEIGA